MLSSRKENRLKKLKKGLEIVVCAVRELVIFRDGIVVRLLGKKFQVVCNGGMGQEKMRMERLFRL